MASVSVQRYSVDELKAISYPAWGRALAYANNMPYHDNAWSEQFQAFARKRYFTPDFKKMPVSLQISVCRFSDDVALDIKIVPKTDIPLSRLKGLTKTIVNPTPDDIKATRNLKNAIQDIIKENGKDARFDYSHRSGSMYGLFAIEKNNGKDVPLPYTLDTQGLYAVSEFSEAICARIRKDFMKIYIQHITDILNIRGCTFDSNGVRRDDARAFGNEIAKKALMEFIERPNAPFTVTTKPGTDPDTIIHDYTYMEICNLGQVEENTKTNLWRPNKGMHGNLVFTGPGKTKESAYVTMLKRGMSWQLE